MKKQFQFSTKQCIFKCLFDDPDATNSEIKEFVEDMQHREISYNINGSLIKHCRYAVQALIEQKTRYVVVYGTLLRGYGNYRRVLENRSDFIVATTIRGFKMYTQHGGYPYLDKTDNPEDVVHVEVFHVNELVFRNCDRLEGYPTHYDRVEVDTESGHKGWVYFYPTQHDHGHKGTFIESGSWTKWFNEERKTSGLVWAL